MRPIINSKNIQQRGNQEKTLAELNLANQLPKINSKNPGSLTGNSIHENQQPGAVLNDYNEPALIVRYQKNLDKLAKRVVAEMLNDANGNFDPERTQKLYTTPVSLTAKRPIPRTWPQNLISAKHIHNWADALTERFEPVYKEAGVKGYAQQLMAEIFDVATTEKIGLPDHVWNLCVMLDKQATEQCLAAALPLEEISSVRKAIMDKFMLTRVITPHLRPVGLHHEKNQLNFNAIDKSLCVSYRVHFDKFFAKIASASEAQLSSNAKAMQALMNAPAEQPLQSHVEEIMGEDYFEINKLGRKTGFFKDALIILESNSKNPKRLLTCLLLLYKSAPKEVGGIQEKLWDDDVNFFFKNRNVIEKLPRPSMNYFYGQLELMGKRHYQERAGDRNIDQVLNFARRIPPNLQEDDEEES